MKTKDEMLRKYDELYSEMVRSKDPAKMKIFGNAEHRIFKELVSMHPNIAEDWLDTIEAVSWNNYLSKKEAENIDNMIVNQNGEKGFHWTYNDFVKIVESSDGNIEAPPFYNSYALFVTANMIYSDHAVSIAKDMGFDNPRNVPNDRMALSCYRKAVEKLKDIDRPEFIRTYMHLAV